MTLAQDVWIARFEAYCEHVGISHAALGQMAVNDGRFMARLRLGHCTLRVVNAVAAFTARYLDAAPELRAVRLRRRRPTPVPHNAEGAGPLQVIDPGGRVWPTVTEAARGHGIPRHWPYHAATTGRDGWRYVEGRTTAPASCVAAKPAVPRVRMP